MTKFLTQETPGKVSGLLATSIASMFFLFAITVSNANFQNVENPFPDPFNPGKVVAVLDVVSNSYSKFLDANLISPASQQLAFVTDNVGFVAENAGPQIMKYAGLQSLSSPRPQVAGASTQIVESKYYPAGAGDNIASIQTLYSLLIH